MSLKASVLKNNEAQKKSIAKEVNSILGHIDDELKSAHDQGRHNVVISLPITFAIPYMSNKDSQRIIYYKILASLVDREFNVEIELTKNATLFGITWLSNEECAEIDIQTDVLARHTKAKLSNINLH